MITETIKKFVGRLFAPAARGPLRIARDKHGIDRRNVSRHAIKVCEVLRQHGYDAYIVGGAVRDLIVGLEPKDFDVATNATPEQIRPLFRRARHIALYLPADGEIDPRPLLEAAQKRGKATYLPVLSRWPHTHMTFQRVGNGERWRKNRYGIAEPLPDRGRQREPWALDLVLLPLVGFDERGGRLGMGKGFYDRTLAYLGRRKIWRKPTLLGLAHECQKVDRLDLASWDVPLQGIVSDAGWYGALA